MMINNNIVPDGELESHNIFIKILRIFSVPILNVIPASLVKKMMKKSSHDASAVVANGGSTHALEAMYTRYHRNIFSRGFFQGLADMFWHHVVSQPKALRNRLKITRRIIKEKIIDLSSHQKENTDTINVLSIAGGSSRSTIQTVIDLKNSGLKNKIEVVTIDKDQSALDIGARLAQEAGVSENFSWICGNANDIKNILPSKKFDLVEIVGLLDYFQEDRAIRLMSGAKEVMKDGGYIIIANVMPNSEVPFVHKTGWPLMVYRKEDDMKNLFTKSGFIFSKTDIITEPLKVHYIAIGQKK